MKVPNIFIPEKDLEEKIFQMMVSESKASAKNTPRKQKVNAGQYYWKFVNVSGGKELTLENIKNCLKDLTDEEALEVLDYGKMEKERYLEYLAYR